MITSNKVIKTTSHTTTATLKNVCSLRKRLIQVCQVSQNRQYWKLPSGVLLALALGTASWAQAQSVEPPSREIQLQAQAQVEVSEDWLQMRLSFRTTGSQADVLQRNINTEVGAALKKANQAMANAQAAKGALAMRVRTGGSGVYPKYDKQGRIDRWTGHADLVLEGLDMASIQQVAANIAPFVLVSSGFSLSPAVTHKTESELMLEAIAAFKAKAQAATKAFGYASFEVEQVSVSGSATAAPQARSMGRIAAMPLDARHGADNVSLDVQPGWQWVNVTVGGTVSMR